jgi:hypothetical protein
VSHAIQNSKSLQKGIDATANVTLGHAIHQQWQGNILSHCQGGDKIEELEDEAHILTPKARDRILGEGFYVRLSDPDSSLGRRPKAP